jgi:DNA-3-methyladenine glycosylase II
MKITEACLDHLRKDKVMRKLVDNYELPIRESKFNVYESLIGSIISQQLSTKAAATIHQRFLDLYGGTAPEPKEILVTEIDSFRAVGLSGQKSNYMLNLAEYFSTRSIDNKYWKKLSDEEIISELCQIKGIGIWTVQMMLMFNLKREDVLPIDDLIIRNSIIHYYNIPESTKKEVNQRVIKIAQKWSPYRSVACLYLWAAKDQLSL